MALTSKQRQDQIEQLLREERYADLQTLATRFATSPSTIRRDLNELETAGVIRRHHGGASLVETDESTGGYDFITSDQTHAPEKYAMAEAIAERASPGMTILLDGGTTTYAIARRLVGKRLVIITNSLPIAALFNDISSSEAIVTGGTIYNRLGVLYGPTCEAALAQMHADLAVLSCAGITAEGAWNTNALIASYQRRMISASTETIWAVDPSKFNKRALTLASPWLPGATLLSTAAPSEEIARAIKAAGGKVEVTANEA